MGMALFLFSCVLLCWALKTKQREDSCGDMQERRGGVLSLGGAKWPAKGRGREKPLTHKGLPKAKSWAHAKMDLVKLRL